MVKITGTEKRYRAMELDVGQLRVGNEIIQSPDYNAIEVGLHTVVLLGGNSTYGNFIGLDGGLPEGSDFTPTGWTADNDYPAGEADVSSILGGHDNINNQIAGIIVGGGHNFNKYDANGHGIIGGGSYHVIAAGYSGIFSGRRNTITGGEDFSVIAGGEDNNIVGTGSAIVGGRDNDVTGDYSVVGGFGHRAGEYCYFFGNNISGAARTGVTAFTDSVITTLTAATDNQFIARFANGYDLRGGPTMTRYMSVVDGITAPDAVSGIAQIYVDTADGDLKVKFGDGTTKVLAADT